LNEEIENKSQLQISFNDFQSQFQLTQDQLNSETLKGQNKETELQKYQEKEQMLTSQIEELKSQYQENEERYSVEAEQQKNLVRKMEQKLASYSSFLFFFLL